MGVSATVHTVMYKNSPYYLQYDHLSLLNIQTFLIRQNTQHSSFVPQFQQKRKEKQVRRKHQSQLMAGFVAYNTKRSDI